MWAWERSRDIARVLWIAFAVAWAGLPCGASAGQPQSAIVAEEPAQYAVSAPTVLPSLERTTEPFDLSASNQASSYAAKWRDISAAISSDAEILARCRKEPDHCPPAARQLLAIAATARTKDGRARLGEVNRTLNLAIRYQRDSRQHGALDVWTSPLATLSSSMGDCEDYAIAKYLALREAGVPPDELRLVVVWDTKLQQDHAVLAARLDGRWVVLDSRRFLLLDDHDVRDYVAVTAFGSEIGAVFVAAEADESTPDLRHPPAPERDPS